MIFRLLQRLSLSPTLDADNPVFRYGMAQLPDRRKHRVRGFIVIAVIVALCVAVPFAVWLWQRNHTTLTRSTEFILFSAVVIGFLASYLLDLIVVAFSATSHHMIQDLELNRLVSLPLDSILTALSRLAFQRLWALIGIFFGLRLGVALGILIYGVSALIYLDEFQYLGFVIPWAVGAFIYCLEVIWRTRITVLIGVMVPLTHTGWWMWRKALRNVIGFWVIHVLVVIAMCISLIPIGMVWVFFVLLVLSIIFDGRWIEVVAITGFAVLVGILAGYVYRGLLWRYSPRMGLYSSKTILVG